MFYEKKVDLQQPSTDYRDLLPVDDIQNGNEYLNALSWAFKNKRVKNIALAGPYGAGKSSIIESFLKKYWWIRRKSLRISMASFEVNSAIYTDTERNDKKRKTPIEQEEIEHGILKQLFYKVGYGKIPQSRYRKLHKVSTLWTWITVGVGGVLLMIPSKLLSFCSTVSSMCFRWFSGCVAATAKACVPFPMIRNLPSSDWW